MSDENPKDALRRVQDRLESAKSYRRALETEKDPGYYERALLDYDRRIDVLQRRRGELIARHEDLDSLIEQQELKISQLRSQLNFVRQVTAADRERRKLDKVLTELSKISAVNGLRQASLRPIRPLEPEDFLDTIENDEELESAVLADIGIADSVDEYLDSMEDQDD